MFIWLSPSNVGFSDTELGFFFFFSFSITAQTRHAQSHCISQCKLKKNYFFPASVPLNVLFLTSESTFFLSALSIKRQILNFQNKDHDTNRCENLPHPPTTIHFLLNVSLFIGDIFIALPYKNPLTWLQNPPEF